MDKSPRPERCWQRIAGSEKPDWINFDLDEQSVVEGDWLVQENDESYIAILHDWQFEETYK